MFKMVIEFEQNKVVENGYTLDELHKQINKLMRISDIVILNDGYYEYESDFDQTAMLAIISFLSKSEWFTNCVSKWKYYDNESWEDLMPEWVYEKTKKQVGVYEIN